MEMYKTLRRIAAVAVLLPALLSLMVLLRGRPNGPLIVTESGTVLDSPALCSSNPMCHVGSLTGGGVEILGAPVAYRGGMTYSLELEIRGLEFLTRVYGFQVAAFFTEDGSPAGTLVAGTVGTQLVSVPGQVPVLTHTDPLDSGHVSFSWTAPEVAQREVTIRVASNSADGNFSPTNDLINTDEVRLVPEESMPVGDTLFYFPQVGAGELGDIRFLTELVFLNSGAEPAPLKVDLFDSQGIPLLVLLRVDGGILEPGTGIETVLQAGQNLIAQTTANAGLQVGYARVLTNSKVGGTAIFTQLSLPTERIQYQAGVPATTVLRDFSFPVQFDSQISDTGVALVLPFDQASMSGEAAVAVVLRLYDREFELIETTTVAIGSGEHIPRFVSQFFPEFFGSLESPFRGSVTVQSAEALAPLTLLQTSEPTLTAFPVVPGRADSQ